MTQRSKDGKFQKGQSGNPSGRSKKRREIEAIAQDALQNPDGSNKAIEALKRIAEGLDDDAKASDRIKANELLLAYGFGKPTQIKESKVTHNFGDLSDEDLSKRLAEAQTAMGDWTATQ